MHDGRTFNNHRGRMGRRLDVANVSVAEIHDQGGRMAEHCHDRPHFWLMLRGRYRVQTGRKVRSVGPGALVYTAAGQPHRDHIETPLGFGITIAVDGGFAASQLGDLALPDCSAIVGDPYMLRLAHQVRAELQVADAASRPIVTGLALDLLGQLCRRDRGRLSDEPLLARATALIADRFSSSDLSVKWLAEELRVHPVHLARIFRAGAGIAPAEYILRYRCARAAEMLRTSRSLVSIALGCGFSDQSSFNRAFRRACATTPGTFRKMVR